MLQTVKMTTVNSVPPLESPSVLKSTATSVIAANASSVNEKFKFSPGGQELALTTNDGRMHVWDAQTGQIKHQYIPSKHLSAVCTCLSWMPLVDPTSTPHK